MAAVSAPDQRADDIRGRRFGRYEPLAFLGAGGMARVYVGRAVGVGRFERLVAIKVCSPELRADRELAARFLDEARVAAMIHHPHVVPTLDVGEADDALFLVMEYVEGESLSALARAARAAGAAGAGVMPTPIALRVVADALRGLHAAHELAGRDGAPLALVHRDVSPQNILVGTDGLSRITDFGIAKLLAEASHDTTRTGEIRGKPSYMSPEQMRSQPLDRRSDVFSMGVVLWELVTGKRLFRAPTLPEVASRLLHAAIPPPSTHGDVAPELERAIMAALDRDRDARTQTAAAFADALEAVPGIASQRDVGLFVESTCAATIVERRRRVGAARDGEAAAIEAPSATDDAASSVRVKTDSLHAKRGATRTRVLVGVSIAVLVAVLAAGMLWGMHLGAGPAHPAAREPIAAAVPEVPSEPAAPPMPPATAPPAAPETPPPPPLPAAHPRTHGRGAREHANHRFDPDTI